MEVEELKFKGNMINFVDSQLKTGLKETARHNMWTCNDLPSLSLKHTLSLFQTDTLSLSLSHTHTRTHSHTLSLSLICLAVTFNFS